MMVCVSIMTMSVSTQSVKAQQADFVHEYGWQIANSGFEWVFLPLWEIDEFYVTRTSDGESLHGNPILNTEYYLDIAWNGDGEGRGGYVPVTSGIGNQYPHCLATITVFNWPIGYETVVFPTPSAMDVVSELNSDWNHYNDRIFACRYKFSSTKNNEGYIKFNVELISQTFKPWNWYGIGASLIPWYITIKN